MFYAPTRLLMSSPFDFTTTYNAHSCNPNTASMLQELQGLRNNFYQTMQGISEKNNHQRVDAVDWFPLLQYLDKTPDLVEYAVTDASFPIGIQWHSGAFPGNPHTVLDDNEVAATTELLWSRMTLAWGMISSARGHVSELRLAVSQQNAFKVNELVKDLRERLVFAAVRLYKLNFCANLIYPGLKNKAGPVECTRDYALASYKIIEVNLASVMIEMMLHPANGTVLTDDKVNMIVQMSSLALEKLRSIAAAFQNLQCPQTTEVLAYCAMAEKYFDAMLCLSIFKLNLMMKENVTEKTKSYETIVIENKVLADHLFDYKEGLERDLAAMGGQSSPLDFVQKENLQHILSHFAGRVEGDMSKELGSFAALKPQLKKDEIDNTSIESIKAMVITGSDVVNDYVKNQAKIDA